MIEHIDVSVVWEGRAGGTTWFHPRPCRCPEGYLMTCQSITGSDVFGQVHWSECLDAGAAWTDPRPIAGLGRSDLADGLQEGVCDVVPEYHAESDTVLAIGMNVSYKDDVLARGNAGRHPVYIVRDRHGNWATPKPLEWHKPETPAVCSCGCSQRLTREDGRVLLPLSIGMAEGEPRSVGTVLCDFDGETLRIAEAGNTQTNGVRRGLIEPSLVAWKGRIFITIRAEDERGYVAVSDDGLAWPALTPWRWDDGEPLTMSTTQQHWLAHGDALFLVYTRKAEANANVFRWRAPLYIARVDADALCLLRETEQVAIPMIGDGVNDPDHVARMGNFSTLNATPDESWVLVGETLPHDNWRGNTLLARIRWTRPNTFSDGSKEKP